MDSTKNKMNIKTKRGIIKKLAIMLIIIIPIIVILAVQEPQKKEFLEDKIVQTNNYLEKGQGIVTNIWFSNSSKLKEFEEAGIIYLIVDVGDTDTKGRLETGEQEINKFLYLIAAYENKNNYSFILLPYSEINTYNYDFDNLEFRNNLIAYYVHLVEMGFDGIHVDIEPIQFHQRATYLKFLDELKQNFDNNIVLSVYVGHLGESYANEWEWDTRFYQDVGKYVHLISVPGYDIDLKTKEKYQKDIADKIRKLSTMELSSQIIFGIPTHKPEPETIQNALEIYNSEIHKYTGTRFIGVVIFAEWTTDDNEWKIFKGFDLS